MFMVNENELINKIAKGNRNAFRMLYELYASKVYNMVLHRINDSNLAEDITQEVFLTIYSKSIQFRGDSKVGTWIYRIAYNKCMDELKKINSTNQNQINYKLQLSQQDVSSSTSQQIELEILLNAINQLNENQKQAFTLTYLDKIPQQEVAEILNMNIKALESLLFRARQSLQKIILKNKGFKK